MASELDEFFAKKEKKKKKTKGKKFVTTEEIVKTIDTTENEATDNTASVLEKTASSNTKVTKPAPHRLLEHLNDRLSMLCSVVWRGINLRRWYIEMSAQAGLLLCAHAARFLYLCT